MTPDACDASVHKAHVTGSETPEGGIRHVIVTGAPGSAGEAWHHRVMNFTLLQCKSMKIISEGFLESK